MYKTSQCQQILAIKLSWITNALCNCFATISRSKQPVCENNSRNPCTTCKLYTYKTPERDGRTDGKTDRQTDLPLILQRSALQAMRTRSKITLYLRVLLVSGASVCCFTIGKNYLLVKKPLEWGAHVIASSVYKLIRYILKPLWISVRLNVDTFASRCHTSRDTSERPFGCV